jgi:hypothetical protein
MDSTYSKLSYEHKRAYVLAALESFSNRWATFANLYDRINLDLHYPVEKLDFIAEKFDYYKKNTAKDKQQESLQKLHSILEKEQPTTEEELAKILSAL